MDQFTLDLGHFRAGMDRYVLMRDMHIREEMLYRTELARIELVSTTAHIGALSCVLETETAHLGLTKEYDLLGNQILLHPPKSTFQTLMANLELEIRESERVLQFLEGMVQERKRRFGMCVESVYKVVDEMRVMDARECEAREDREESMKSETSDEVGFQYDQTADISMDLS